MPTDAIAELQEMAVEATKARTPRMPIPPPRTNTSSFSGPESTVSGRIAVALDSYAPLAWKMPFEILDYIELIATWNPDYSQAVENIKMLANSGHNVYVESKAKRKKRELQSRINEKARTIQYGHGGVDGLIEKLIQQAATFGAMCGEWVLNDQLNDVVDFVDISPKKIRFFWDSDESRYVPFQKVTGAQAQEARDSGQEVRGGNCVRLNEVTFQYFAFNAQPDSPYGVPPFIAALAPIAIQNDMVYNLAQIVKKVGMLALIDLTVQSLPKKPAETDANYEKRAREYLEEYAKSLEDMMRDGGMAHYDDAAIQAVSLAGNAAGATNIFKQNEEMVFSGLKSMPSVQGRCVTPETLVLTAELDWVRAGDLVLGEELVGFDEDLGKGRGRGAAARMKSSFVECVDRIQLPCVKITTDKGEITVSSEHPLVVHHRTHGRVWRHASEMKLGDKLIWFGAPWTEDYSYDAGYLAGIFDGEGTLGFHGSGNNGTIGFSQNSGVVLDETVLALKRLGYEVSAKDLSRDRGVLCKQFRILGGRYETLRFLGSVRPHRFMSKARAVWEGSTLRTGSGKGALERSVYATVIAIEDVGEQEVVALQTSSRTFIAEGLLNHNSYSTTETYAGVAYEIILRNTLKFQRAVKRMMERGYWLMATLWGDEPDGIRIEFNKNKAVQRQQEALAEKTELDNDIRLWAEGIYDQTDVAQRHGVNEPKDPRESPVTVKILGDGSAIEEEDDEAIPPLPGEEPPSPDDEEDEGSDEEQRPPRRTAQRDGVAVSATEDIPEQTMEDQ